MLRLILLKKRGVISLHQSSITIESTPIRSTFRFNINANSLHHQYDPDGCSVAGIHGLRFPLNRWRYSWIFYTRTMLIFLRGAFPLLSFNESTILKLALSLPKKKHDSVVHAGVVVIASYTPTSLRSYARKFRSKFLGICLCYLLKSVLFRPNYSTCSHIRFASTVLSLISEHLFLVDLSSWHAIRMSGWLSRSHSSPSVCHPTFCLLSHLQWQPEKTLLMAGIVFVNILVRVLLVRLF